MAIKDPRSSLLLPLWKRVSSTKLRLSLVLAVRDPSEVITSLVGRDGHIVGMTQSRAQYLWHRHNLEPLHFARLHQLEIIVVDYSRWFLDPTSQLHELCEFFPSPSIDKSSFSSALSLINSDYRRSHKSSSSFQPSSSVRRLYRQLRVGKPPRRLPPLNSCFSSIHSLADNLPSDFDLWHDWLLAHASFPARQYSGTISLATNCTISVCGPSWLDISPHLALQYLPVSSFLNTTIDLINLLPPALTILLLFRPTDDISTDLISDETQLITLNFEFPETERVSDC